MMPLAQRLQHKKEAIAQAWFDSVLATYSKDAAAAFRNQHDPFANPAGHRLRESTRGIVAALLNGRDEEEIRGHLGEVIRLRAVQQFSASQAIQFVFRLKQVIRAELKDKANDPRTQSELTQLEDQIDQVALVAFDKFVECREQVSQLRINEIKRRVSWLVEKLGQESLR